MKFIYHPEYIKIGQAFMIYEDNFKAKGKILKVFK